MQEWGLRAGGSYERRGGLRGKCRRAGGWQRVRRSFRRVVEGWRSVTNGVLGRTEVRRLLVDGGSGGSEVRRLLKLLDVVRPLASKSLLLLLLRDEGGVGRIRVLRCSLY
jgi:hypothetical protein